MPFLSSVKSGAVADADKNGTHVLFAVGIVAVPSFVVAGPIVATTLSCVVNCVATEELVDVELLLSR